MMQHKTYRLTLILLTLCTMVQAAVAEDFETLRAFMQSNLADERGVGCSAKVTMDGETIFLEAFSTGGNSFDTANDTVNNPSDDWVWDGVDWGAQASVSNSSAYTIVPEPASLALLGFGTLVLLRRRR